MNFSITNNIKFISGFSGEKEGIAYISVEDDTLFYKSDPLLPTKIYSILDKDDKKFNLNDGHLSLDIMSFSPFSGLSFKSIKLF